jgi:hypothetical protein
MKGSAVRIRASASRKTLETGSFLKQGLALAAAVGNRMGNERRCKQSVPETMIETLSARAERIQELLAELLTEHSSLRSMNWRSSDIVLIGASNAWGELSPEGRQLQSKLLRELERYGPLIETLVRGAPEATRKSVTKANERLREVIDQSHMSWYDTPAAALEGAVKELTTQLEQLAGLHDESDGVPLYVPDANALIWNPNLEDWAFDDAPRFAIVLTSTLLGELDDLKMPHRGESVREKAEGAIRRIKEYGRRGDIHDGVPLKRDRSTVRMTAAEPDFENTLPWIDRTIKDDRLIAAVVEIVREHPHSPVLLVTRDINMQNKARHAGIAFVEPPDPAERDEVTPRRRGPRPDIRILSLRFDGGSSQSVTFVADVQYRGTQPTRANFSARVDDIEVTCRPPMQDMIGNHMPWQVYIDVPHPGLADLVPEFANEPTLYGRELILEVTADDEHVTSETWREITYDIDTNRDRHLIQQRYWRIGRGEDTEQDHRAEQTSDLLRKQGEKKRSGPGPYDNV